VVVVACARTEPELRALERAIIAQEGTSWPAGLNAGVESRARSGAAWKARVLAMRLSRIYGREVSQAEAERALAAFERARANPPGRICVGGGRRKRATIPAPTSASTAP
jgi:hypothetical protein